MNQQEIETIVIEMLMDELDISSNEISLCSNLKEIADSLEIVEIILEIEKKFDITIPDEIIPKFSTIKSLCEYIKMKKEMV